METVTDFLFLGSCRWLRSHKIKRHLLLGKKAMTNPGNILESRDITMPTKIHRVKAMIFPVVMYGCESWTVRKAEHWRIDAFELWCWRKLFRVPCTARRPNQSILKEISPEYSLEGLMLRLNLQHFGHLMRRTDSLVKTLMGFFWRQEKGMTEDELTGSQHQLNGWWASSRSWWWTETPGFLRGCKESDMTEQVNWTDHRVM